MRKPESELLILLNNRKAWDMPGQHRAPEDTVSFDLAVKQSARAHAGVNRSDPFAYGRIALHMQQGLELPSEVLADAKSRRAAQLARADADYAQAA